MTTPSRAPATAAVLPHASTPPEDPPVGHLVVAFAAVYLVWGSTYLAIRWAVETMPPLGMASVRFYIAGGMMYAWARSRGVPPPTRRQWQVGAVSGTFLLAGGNGAVVVAEQWVPSGLAALLVASVPLWLVVLDALVGSRERPSPRTMFALLTGFAGVGLLAGSPGMGAGGPQELFGVVLIVCGAVAWAAGSLYSRYAGASLRPRMLVAVQMLSGATVLGLLSVLFGEWHGFTLSQVSTRSWLAFVYLTLVGALVGYAAYIWLLSVVPPARAGTYAYVNPVVAMFLGWALADEPLTPRSLLAAAVILGSVVLITTERRPGFRLPDPAPPGPEAP